VIDPSNLPDDLAVPESISATMREVPAPTNRTKADCEMATVPRQREIFLSEGRFFYSMPRVVTDDPLADVLAQ
jgi:hypothetical protein